MILLASAFLVVSDSLQPDGLQPARLLCPRDSPGKDTRVGCHALLQGIVPKPGIEPASLLSPALQARSLPAKPFEKPNVIILLQLCFFFFFLLSSRK